MTLVLETRLDPGSLKAIWPSGPMPPIKSSIPPDSLIFRSYSLHSAIKSGAFPSKMWTFAGSISMCCNRYVVFVCNYIRVDNTIYLISKNYLYLEKVMKHEMVIRLLVIPWQTDIFVHIEGLDILETNFACFVILHKLRIHFQGSTP